MKSHDNLLTLEQRTACRKLFSDGASINDVVRALDLGQFNGSVAQCHVEWQKNNPEAAKLFCAARRKGGRGAAIEMFKAGATVTQVATTLSVDRRNVVRWRDSWQVNAWPAEIVAAKMRGEPAPV